MTILTTPPESYPVVIIDTREQLPYTFPSTWPRPLVTALKTGDYSILGHESNFAIERKSLNDFTGCIFADRFEREMIRLSEFKRAYLLIEANIANLKNPPHYHGNPKALIGKVQSISIRHGVQVIFAGDRQTGQEYTQGLIKSYWKHFC